MERYVADCYQENIYKVNYNLLKSKGLKCLLFDLDNTILPFNEKIVSEEAKELFEKLKEDFHIIIFSNSPKRRVEGIAKQLELEFVASALKPFPKKMLEVMKKYKLTENEIAIIGDQLLTDIKLGNTIGITTVLVKPMSKYDSLFSKLARIKEKKIFKKLRQKNLFTGRFYDEKM